MSGLREKQKADRERRILQAAVRKFRAEGYRAVRIDDLAEMAEVSVGTIYNYYRNKGDILIAVVSMEVEEVLASGATLVTDPPPGVRNAVLSLIYEYYDHSLNYLSKEMWRSAMALSTEAPDTPNGRRYTDLDRRLAGQVAELIETLQARGDLRRDLDAEALGQMIFCSLNQLFMEFIKDDAMRLPDLRDEVAGQLAPLFRMLSAE
jgi:AcrR family transcriptional regulator